MPKASRQNGPVQGKPLNGPALPSTFGKSQHQGISHASTSSSGVASVTAPTKPKSGRGGGGIQGKQTFQVNPNTGTLNFAIPIKTSKSRATVEPSLTLNYGSGYGNGPFGVGWRVNQGAITRKTSKAIPRYDQDDVFLLDGDDDLVPVHQGDDTVESYPTILDDSYVIDRFLPRFINSNKRIERWTKKSDANEVHWVVTSADNVTTIYGSSDESRVFENIHDGGKRIFTWLPAKSYDSLGNSMEYGYKSEDLIGLESSPSHLLQSDLHRDIESISRARYLKSIRYGNRTCNRDLEQWSKIVPTNTKDWMFEVIFDYGEHDSEVPTTQQKYSWSVRQDPFSTYSSGFEVRVYRLCRRILMFHHIPEALGIEDCLVSSTAFQFDEDPAMTSLSSVTFSGYQADGSGGYTKEVFAPWEFHYSKNPDLQTLAIGEIDNFNLAAIPGGVAPFKAEWVDLDGDGAPGLLIENSSKSLYYQRNQSDRKIGARFGPPISLPNQPVMLSKGRYFEDIGRSGQLDLVCTNENGVGLGYYERTKDGWANFKNFDQVLNTKMPSDNLVRIDVVGNGLQDVIILNDDRSEVRWHPCLGEKGFGKANSATMSGSPFAIDSTNNTIMATFADMSGDGLVDIVHVSSGCVSYWPNLGYGRFGKEVIMGNSPVFGVLAKLNQSRIQFADVDGTGTADLLYFPDDGGVELFYNLSGNGWSEPLLIPQFPRLDTLATVSLIDLFGNGTSCLCWTGPDTTGTSRHTLLYLDLTNGHKPHILKDFSNGMGHTWTINYQSSTFFYRLDEAEGKTWKTRLSSPMQCVESTRAQDNITGTCLTTRFRYHDGIYDGVEQEFAGFASVEQWDAEKFDSKTDSFTCPPIHKKIWYHSGCLGYDDHFTTPEGIPSLDGLRVPVGITDLEGFRALRGRALQEELFSDDNSASQMLPYTVTQFSYVLDAVQPKYTNKYPVLRIQEGGVLNCHYERQADHPRCTYSSVIKTDDFGQPLKSVTVAYGHRNSSLLNSRDKMAQQEDIVTYNEYVYTNYFDIKGVYRLPALASMQKWRLLGYKAKVESSEQLIQSINLALQQWKETDAIEADLKPQQCKVLLEEHRTYHRREDLSDYLDLGILEPFSPSSQTYDLVDAKLPGWNKALSETSCKLPDWFKKIPFGYVDLDKNGLQWKPSSREIYSQNAKNELRDARRSFFSPVGAINPLGHQQTYEYDDKKLFQIKNTDAMGNVSFTAYSYTTLQPTSIEDPNGNRVQFAYDASGEMIGQAQMGKRGEDAGDSVDSAPLAMTPLLLDRFISDPIKEAASILGKFTTRTIKDRTRYHRYLLQGKSQPCFEATIGRSTHAHEGSPGTISIKITYWDSQGHPIQHIDLTSINKKSVPTWCVYGGTLKNNKGEVVREYHPVLSDSHSFRPYENLAKKATTFLLDPLGRRIATLNADHTWKKTVLSAWEKMEYDEADTVLTGDASQDEHVGSYFRLLNRDLYFPSWYGSKRQPGSDATVLEESGANAVFHDTPSVEYFDALGRLISSTADKNGLEATTSITYSCLGYESCRYDSLGRTVETVTQDLVQSYRIVRSMDSVAAHTVQNAVNLPVLSWTEGGPLRICVYDSLGRVTEVWISRRGAEPFLWQKNVYGESISNAEKTNLKGQLYKCFDQSGLSTHAKFDFKGNCLAKTKQLAINYKDDLDWSGSVHLEDEVFNFMFCYDAQNHVISAQGPDGDITKTQYNNWGHPNSVLWQASAADHVECIVAETNYNADQQTVLIKHGNGGQSRYIYDEITGSLNEKIITRPNGAKIEHKMYIHDCLGRETFVKDDAQQAIFFNNHQVMPKCRFRYDGLGRLISATGREQVNVGSGTSRSFSFSKAPNTVACEIPSSGKEMAEYLEEYRYDLAGNILKMSHKCPNDTSIRGWVRNYFYTEKSLLKPAELSNRLSCTEVADHTETYKYPPPDVYDYDNQGGGASGCMTSMPGFSSLSWDFENRLKSSSSQIQKEGTPETTYYVYDSSGSRVRKVTERSSAVNSQKTRLSETLYMDNFTIYRKFNGNGVAVSLEKRSVHVRASKIVGIIESCPVGKSLVTNLMRLKLDDGLEVDKESRIILHEEYSPFGATTYSACRSDITAPAVYRYASYERDQETGLYHVGHRYYAPWLGRWISPDPLGIADGLNRYAYVGNNPIMFVDPEGTERIDKLGADNGGQRSWLSNAKYYGSIAVGGFALAYITKKSAGKVIDGNKMLVSGLWQSSYEAKMKDYLRATAQAELLKARGQRGDVKYNNPFLGEQNYNRLRSITSNPMNLLKENYGVPKFTGLDKPSEELYHLGSQYSNQAVDSLGRYIPKYSDPLFIVYDVGKSIKEGIEEAKFTMPLAYAIDQAEGNRKEGEKTNGAEAHKQGADFVRAVEKIDKDVKKLDKSIPAAYQTVKNIFVDPNVP